MSGAARTVVPQTRIKVWRQLLVRPVVGVSLTLIAVLSNLEWLRDHLLPDALRKKLQFDALPYVSWQTWAAVSAIMIVALTLEAAFRQSRELHEQLTKSIIAFEPAVVIRYLTVDRPGMPPSERDDYPDEFLGLRNVGDLPLTNVSIEPIRIGMDRVDVRGAILVLVPDGSEERLECVDLNSNLYNARRRMAEAAGKKRHPLIRVTMTLHCYDRTQTKKASVDYVLTQDERDEISFRRLRVGDPGSNYS